jgi:hypothetical protein
MASGEKRQDRRPDPYATSMSVLTILLQPVIANYQQVGQLGTGKAKRWDLTLFLARRPQDSSSGENWTVQETRSDQARLTPDSRRNGGKAKTGRRGDTRRGRRGETAKARQSRERGRGDLGIHSQLGLYPPNIALVRIYAAFYPPDP